MSESAFIALGSNIQPDHYLVEACRNLERLGAIIARSNVYRTKAVGPRPQADFLNAAVLLRTGLTPLALREQLRIIEAHLHRRRGKDRYAPRTIDLDLCMYGGMILEVDDLILPDPDTLRYAFLAVPMAELAPDFIHPANGQSLAAIAARFDASQPNFRLHTLKL
ncbi:2-amino-4-hydroxy-6-hydroxymethyldihydropteridine diphosphokinase [bacterium]|nr:2-amino-4-hydroxy-6-hydroxymethyldihydropteridine diphosphokinase [candidate division CSSED10-310 bacterium]